MYLPGIPAHVVQRGNTTAMPVSSQLMILSSTSRMPRGQGLRRYGVKLPACVLMTNHVHLLMAPEKETSISRARLMQPVGRLSVLSVNKTCRRRGTLVAGRHKARLS